MHVSYASKKLLIKQKTSLTSRCVTLEGLWMISDMDLSIFRFFVKFHRSWSAIIFSFWTTTEHVSYASKKLLIKQRTSSTWCVLLWKDYGWLPMELSIFRFFIKFHKSGPAIILSFWIYHWRMLVMHKQTASNRRKNTSLTWCER